MAEDLYALSPAQRSALERYKESVTSARSTRASEKRVKEEQKNKDVQKERQKIQMKKPKGGARREQKGDNVREVELRAARQAALFAQVRVLFSPFFDEGWGVVALFIRLKFFFPAHKSMILLLSNREPRLAIILCVFLDKFFLSTMLARSCSARLNP